MPNTKNAALSRTKANLLKGDKVQDLEIKGKNVEEVTSFFMEFLGADRKKTHIKCKSEQAVF